MFPNHTPNSTSKKALALAATASRLAIAERIHKKIKRSESIIRLLAAFIIADIADGVIARKLGVDGPRRRTADTLIDRMSVARAGHGMIQSNPASRPYLPSASLLLAQQIPYIMHIPEKSYRGTAYTNLEQFLLQYLESRRRRAIHMQHI